MASHYLSSTKLDCKGIDTNHMNLHDNQEMLRIVAILRGTSHQQALDAAAVFVKAGIKAIEVTCNTPDVVRIIASLSEKYGEQLAIGAGTVMTGEEVESVKRAGASFILSPDCNPEVIKATKDAGLFSVPGAFTASEVTKAHRAGADMVKLFPAGRLGPGYMKDLLGPLDHIKFMAVGGIDLTNSKDFLNAGAKAVGIGSSLVNIKLIKSGEFLQLKKLAVNFVESIYR